MKSMNDLMLHFLQDIYYAEKASVRGMAKIARAVDNPELKQAVLEHRDQTQGHVARLEQVFEAFNKRPRGKACAAMNGLIEESDEAVEEGEKGPVLDAALIACAQAIEHYEVARYGAMAAWARTMGKDEAAGLLQQTLDEEKANDAKLNEIAERALNPQAAESGEADDEEDEGEDEEPEGGREESAPAKPTRGRRAASARTPASPKPAPAKPARGRAARK